jgi:hypothetical protein
MRIIDHGVYPLAVNSKSQLLFFRSGNLYLKELKASGTDSFLMEMPDYKRRIISYSRLVERVLRNLPGPCIALGLTAFIYHYKSRVYRVDLLEKKVYLELHLEQSRKILYFTKQRCANTGLEIIYFGEYFENKAKETVHVWQRDTDGQWRIYSTFPADTIEHVHNIVVDTYRNRLLILTGDFGESSGIWSLELKGQTPFRLVGGSQMYRAAWMYVDESRMIYATDTPFEQNYLIEIDLTLPGLALRKLHAIHGSSIYGGVRQDDTLYFSTSVEPIELTGNRFFDIFQRKRGVGINDDNSYVYKYTISSNLMEVIIFDEKDLVPMRLGQYGSFVMSETLTDGAKVFVYGVALRKYDNTLLEF